MALVITQAEHLTTLPTLQANDRLAWIASLGQFCQLVIEAKKFVTLTIVVNVIKRFVFYTKKEAK